MTIQHRLQRDDHVAVGHRGGSLQQRRLIELIERTVQALQPEHDRRGHYLAHAVLGVPTVVIRIIENRRHRC
ncbi:hypothetical protein DE4576_05484 [Mycobacterium marinum]|nr:hypothetical protein DE4576_05484 [Mycobacterium marinum]